MAANYPALAILQARIRIALRRATGQMVDVEARLTNPSAVAAAFTEWRLLGVPELDALLSQYEQVMAGPSAAHRHPHPSAPATAPPQPPHGVRGNSIAPAVPATPAEPADPPDDPGPPSPGGRRYLRGAR